MLVWHSDSAESDLDAIADWFGDVNPAAGLNLLDRIADTEERLSAWPEAGKTGRVMDPRERVVTGTPFILVYRITGMQIEVVRILHGRQQWP